MRFYAFLSIFGLLLIFPVPVAAGGSAESRCQRQDGAWHETKVFFGLSKANGNAISRHTLDGYIRDKIVPAFPDGFTLIETTGYWYNKDLGATAYENGLQLTIVHPATPAFKARINAVAEQYRKQFHQYSVLISTTNAQVRSCMSE